MPGSTVLKFTDPDEYQAAMGRSSDSKMVVTGAGNYRSETMFVDLQQVRLADVKIALPPIVRGVLRQDLCVVSFSTEDSQAALIVNGAEVPKSYLAFGGSGAEFVTSISANYHWSGLMMAPEVLVTPGISNSSVSASSVSKISAAGM